MEVDWKHMTLKVTDLFWYIHGNVIQFNTTGICHRCLEYRGCQTYCERYVEVDENIMSKIIEYKMNIK